MQVKMCGNEYRSTVVCIDSYEKHGVQGRMYNPFFPGAVSFASLMDYLLSMDALLDEMNFPQPFAETRSFRPQNVELDAVSLEGFDQRGELCTFVVKVLFRQNASWQGSILWMEGKKEESFRSVLELLYLMSSALDCAKDTELKSV